jgi:hypothetical protein
MVLRFIFKYIDWFFYYLDKTSLSKIWYQLPLIVQVAIESIVNLRIDNLSLIKYRPAKNFIRILKVLIVNEVLRELD